MGEPTRLDRFHTAVQLAGFHYIACLKAQPTKADHELTFGKSTYVFMSIAGQDDQYLHWEFQNWAATSVLRDLLEHFSVFLMEVYRDAVAANASHPFSRTVDDFERAGIETQLAMMSDNFSISPDWVSRLTGFNRARNSLAHRGGVVGAKDLTHGGELVLRWLTSSAVVNDGPITPTVEAQGPMSHLIRGQHISGEKAATMSVLDRERRFKVGEHLRLLPDELLEISQTFHIAAAALNAVVEAPPLSKQKSAPASTP